MKIFNVIKALTTGFLLITSCSALSHAGHGSNAPWEACEEKAISPVLSKAMDRIFLLHADHEQNASTSTVRLAGSTGANPFACIASGIAALWGPAHGGANEAVLNMLEEIGDVSNIDTFVAKAKDKEDPFRLMGFGHRVYKNFDPRAKIIKKSADEVLAQLGVDDPVLDIRFFIKIKQLVGRA
mgnify:CR=1 FL=1